MAGKADIVDTVVNAVDGLTKKQAAETFDAIFGAITDTLADGERVVVPGFGSFSVSHRPARDGRNPATGEKMTIAASNNAKFKPGKELKEAING
ncbi:MAG: HU family DNA-binding protein [Acidobacteria bacterium]|nr:HU family DNA-binding protein [Acidobacteriota bacterium]